MSGNSRSGVRVDPYVYSSAEVVPRDRRAERAAAQVAEMIGALRADLVVEHVGSTAVRGCAGKGIVDVMVAYPDGRLDEARAAVDALGFQRQTFGDPFGEDRPMRVGSLEVDGASFRVHVHVVSLGSPEAAALRRFRDRLRRDACVRRAYVALKRRLVRAGITDSPHYARSKGTFIQAVLNEEVAADTARRRAG